MSAWDDIKQAIAGNPKLGLLSGVAAIGAVISVVLGYTGDNYELAVIGGLIVVGFMILLAIFISVTSSQQQYPYLAAFLIWAISFAFIGTIFLVMSSYFMCWPQGLGRSCTQRQYVRGEISNLPSPAHKEIGVSFEDYALGAFQKDLKRYRFVVFDHKGSDRDTMTVTVRPTDRADDRDEDIKVHLSCIERFRHAGKMIAWRYRELDQAQPDGSIVKTPALFEGSRKIGEFGLNIDEPIRCDRDAPQPRSAAVAPGFWSRFLPGLAAHAQEAPAAPTPDVREAIKNLTAEDAATRRSARSILADGSTAAVPAILEVMRQQPENYRVQLGGSVAMTEMLRQNKAEAPRIAGVITAEEDRALLLKAAGHPDRTLRIYASEFLYDLGDPEISRKALALAAKTSDENARYNWLLVAQGGWGKFTPDQKVAASADLAAAHAAAGPMTRKLFDKLQ
ncbi:hypothetical protein FQV39_25235 [Bosea sp. F3-2]|uniref:HEAT repeat domain-containing protein n=1 Tax=Bosea sp. F3-2 TaxID=2599640 RepID=UPI0011EF5671|nr:hypothetical protein [Bosea sp. F3-2]QEL25525.1 hypothetical protein FQV39_25235 [Bosea sp. F3-2]